MSKKRTFNAGGFLKNCFNSNSSKSVRSQENNKPEDINQTNSRESFDDDFDLITPAAATPSRPKQQSRPAKPKPSSKAEILDRNERAKPIDIDLIDQPAAGIIRHTDDVVYQQRAQGGTRKARLGGGFVQPAAKQESKTVKPEDLASPIENPFNKQVEEEKPQEKKPQEKKEGIWSRINKALHEQDSDVLPEKISEPVPQAKPAPVSKPAETPASKPAQTPAGQPLAKIGGGNPAEAKHVRFWDWIAERFQKLKKGKGIKPVSMPEPSTGGDDEPPRHHGGFALRLLFGITVLFFVAFILWASFFTINVASTAEGEVMPSTQIKWVQHLEGGIVEKILVKEGETVDKDQPLVILEATISAAEVNTIKLKIASEQVDILRLTAEINGEEEIVYPEDIVRKYSDLIAESDKLFKYQNNRYKNELQANEEDVIQKTKAVQEISQRLKHAQEELLIIMEQVSISEKLLDENVTNLYTHLSLLREAKALQSKVAQDIANLSKIQSELAEARNVLQGFISLTNEERSQELEEKRRELQADKEQLARLEDMFKRTILRSPVNGIVRQMYVFTKGAVVQPGSTVMDILPLGDRLVVDAKLQIQDIGYIEVGQEAVIRLASADAMRFDAIEGTVSVISPDAIKDEEGNAYYKVRIETKEPYFERGNVKYQLYPGMKVSVSIITGHRSIMGYLLDPVFGASDSALKER